MLMMIVVDCSDVEIETCLTPQLRHELCLMMMWVMVVEEVVQQREELVEEVVLSLLEVVVVVLCEQELGNYSHHCHHKRWSRQVSSQLG